MSWLLIMRGHLPNWSQGEAIEEAVRCKWKRLCRRLIVY